MASQKPHSSDQPLLRSHILDAARAIVVRQGFDALSMRKLAEVVGYSPASLYLHFAGRDAIAHALGAEGYARLLAALHSCDSIADELERVKSMAHGYVEFGRTHPAVYRLIFMQNCAYTVAIFSDTAISGETPLSVFAKALAPFNLSPAAAETLWTALHGIVSLSLTAAKYLSTPTDALIDSTLELCLSGVGKKPVRSSGSRAV
ncbi:TetR family transcriptional regulator [Caballeronia sordidicola]|uniref:TetR family transcriptional regulator n=1 Tax=Caballeronia sordidicola TaxID=196367 RepID=A0A158H321_CABSO|nr:TetR/AcrR family transcriptional regulator [Caballeronia sordidicola]SAL38732.1 TetR family transcriptional regulator [Caballeronia sordidicola]